MGQRRNGGGAENSEAQGKDDDVGQGGDDTQKDSVPQLEGQHGVHCEDDEEEEGNL